MDSKTGQILSTQGSVEDVFSHLQEQDIEQFYAHYQLWVLRHRLPILEQQLETLREHVAENQQLIQDLHPSAIALAVLARLQSRGVADVGLLDAMLERGEDWLDRMMQRLDYCEQVEDFIQGDYTQWCVNSLEGAYDWIDTLRDSPAEEAEATGEVATSDEVQATEELLLQRLRVDDAEVPDEVTPQSPVVESAASIEDEDRVGAEEMPDFAQPVAMDDWVRVFQEDTDTGMDSPEGGLSAELGEEVGLEADEIQVAGVAYAEDEQGRPGESLSAPVARETAELEEIDQEAATSADGPTEIEQIEIEVPPETVPLEPLADAPVPVHQAVEEEPADGAEGSLAAATEEIVEQAKEISEAEELPTAEEEMHAGVAEIVRQIEELAGGINKAEEVPAREEEMRAAAAEGEEVVEQTGEIAEGSLVQEEAVHAEVEEIVRQIEELAGGITGTKEVPAAEEGMPAVAIAERGEVAEQAGEIAEAEAAPAQEEETHAAAVEESAGQVDVMSSNGGSAPGAAHELEEAAITNFILGPEEEEEQGGLPWYEYLEMETSSGAAQSEIEEQVQLAGTQAEEVGEGKEWEAWLSDPDKDKTLPLALKEFARTQTQQDGVESQEENRVAQVGIASPSGPELAEKARPGESVPAPSRPEEVVNLKIGQVNQVRQVGISTVPEKPRKRSFWQWLFRRKPKAV